MSPEVLSIFYSTIALSMATIIAFGGIFTIYRLQEINGEITRTRKSFKEYWRRRILYTPLTDEDKRTDWTIKVAENKREKDSQEVNEWLDKDVFHILLSIPTIINDNGLIDYFTQLNHQMNFKSKLYREIVFPTVLIVITFVASILSFLSLQNLNCNDSFYWLTILACFAIFAFFEVIKYVNMAIAEPPEEYINNALTESSKELRVIRITQIKNEIKKRIPIEEKKIKENLEKQIRKSNDANKKF